MKVIYNPIEGLPFTIVAEPHDYHCDFICYQSISTDVNQPLYRRKDDSNQWTENISEAEIFLSGFVKWDECSNWLFNIQDDCMIHFCVKEEAEQVGRLFGRLYDLAAELIPNWNGD